MKDKSFCFLYKKISKRAQNYFYNKNIYKKLKIILESDLREIDIKINDTKINYLNEKKITFQKLQLLFLFIMRKNIYQIPLIIL